MPLGLGHRLHHRPLEMSGGAAAVAIAIALPIVPRWYWPMSPQVP